MSEVISVPVVARIGLLSIVMTREDVCPVRRLVKYRLSSKLGVFLSNSIYDNRGKMSILMTLGVSI